MATKKTYREAQELSKLNPNQVMDMILHDPKIDDNTFRSIAIMAGATVEDIFVMNTTSQMAIPRKKEKLVLHMRKQQNKPSGLRVTPLLGLVSTGAIAWYINHIASQHNQTLAIKNSSSSAKKSQKQQERKRVGGSPSNSWFSYLPSIPSMPSIPKLETEHKFGFNMDTINAYEKTLDKMEKYASHAKSAVIFTGVAITLYSVGSRLLNYKLQNKTRKREFSIHKKKMQLEKEHQIQLYQFKQQQSLIHQGYNLVKGLSQYKQQLKIVPLFASVVLAYSTMKSFSSKKKQKSIFNVLFYKHSGEPVEAVPHYSGNLKPINANLHRCFESYPHPTKASEQNKNMQRLMYCLIKQNQKKWFQKNVHLHVSHFVLPSGHLRQSPASIANTIVKNRKLYEYLFTVPMMLTNMGSSVLQLFTRKKKRKSQSASLKKRK